MDGITILNYYNTTETIYEPLGMWWIGLIVFGISLLVGFGIGCYADLKTYGLKISSIAGLIAGIIATLFFQFIPTSKKIQTDILNYEVTIDETVSMQDFTSKYEIIEQRGKIYVVQERQEQLENQSENQ